MKTNNDIHQRITDQIVAAIEDGVGDWKMPWSGKHGLPVNGVSGRNYRGVNILALWLAQNGNGWGNEWATYRQWESVGAQVRKGERSTLVIFYKTYDKPTGETGDDGEPKVERIFIARGFSVFNAAQVDDYEPKGEEPKSAVEISEAARRYVENTGAQIRDGGGRAFYRPPEDFIGMPPEAAFKGTDTSTATEAYYGTLLHETTHWTGHESRLNRDLKNRFGDDAYAAEELIAELGAAFLCGALGITHTPREDHAQYIAHWLRVLKGDKRAIFTAASKASQAVDFLDGLQTPKAA